MSKVACSTTRGLRLESHGTSRVIEDEGALFFEAVGGSYASTSAMFRRGCLRPDSPSRWANQQRGYEGDDLQQREEQ